MEMQPRKQIAFGPGHTSVPEGCFRHSRQETRSSTITTTTARTKWSLLLLISLVLFLCGVDFGSKLAAQSTPPPASPDPLMNLMLTQPKIDVNTPVTATAIFDPPSVRPGREAAYRVVVNALEESVEWPSRVSGPAGLEIRPGAHGQMLSPGGGMLLPRTGFNSWVRAARAGDYTVPSFTVIVYGKPVTVPAATLTVAEAAPAAAAPERLMLEVDRTNLFAGQSVRARIRFPASPGGVLLPLQTPPVQIAGDGLIVDQSSLRQHTEFRPRSEDRLNGGVVMVFEVAMTPIAAGKIAAIAQSFVGNRFGPGAVVFPGNGAPPVTSPLPQFTLLESSALELNVRKLPTEGMLPGFTGAVGHFMVDDANLNLGEVPVGSPVKLTVRIRGDVDSNLMRLVPPPAPTLRDWQILLATGPTSSSTPQAQGVASFVYTLIPQNAAVKSTPAIPFSYFDPDRAVYVNLPLPSLPIRVTGGALGAEPAPAGELETASQTDEKEPVLQDLATAPGMPVASLVPLQRQAWFAWIQLAPAALFIGLWSWDRRRRFLELHPEVIRFRHARRALRRERRALRQALRAGDATGYASAAVQAMRVACAPHYPAHPRAIVGQDVLPLLPASDQAGRAGEVIRRFFAVADAQRFASAPANPAELVQLQNDFENVLTKLEERL